MNFAFVSMEYQEIGFPLKNENALVILNRDNEPAYVAHRGEFKQLGTWIPSPHVDTEFPPRIHVDTEFLPHARAKIIGGSQHSNLHLEYESWQQKGTIWDENMEVELYNPISVSPFENPQQKLVFADITVYADDLWKSGGYASREPVRNKSALVCINAESEIIFIAQAHKFRKVSHEELVVHKLPQDPKYKRYSIAKHIEFDHLNWSWEK